MDDDRYEDLLMTVQEARVELGCAEQQVASVGTIHDARLQLARDCLAHAYGALRAYKSSHQP